MPPLNLKANTGRDTLLASAARTTSGSSVAFGGFGAAGQLVLQVNVTAVTGTAPTLVVTLEDTIDGTNWNTVTATGNPTASITATGRTVIRVAITNPFTDTIRVSYTIGGTAPSFTFDVQVFSCAFGINSAG